MSRLLLPTPVQVLRCLGGMMATVSFWKITCISICRILLGVSLAVLLGTVLAVLTENSRWLNVLIAPAMTAMQATPVASFTILVLIWLDRDYVPVLICGMMGLPIVWSSVGGGIRATDPQLLEMAKVYRLPGFQTVRRIYVPSVMPFFRMACSSALGLGWKAGIAAEVLTVPRSSIPAFRSLASITSHDRGTLCLDSGGDRSESAAAKMCAAAAEGEGRTCLN